MSERPMTPFAPFAPFDPNSIPKAPRVPSDIDELQRKDVRDRDTDQAQLGDEPGEPDEQTPAVRPETSIEMVLRRLGEIETATQDANKMQKRVYDLLLKIDSDNKRARRRHAALARRVLMLEVSRRWVPSLAWLVTTLVSLFALFRTYR